MQLIKLLVKNLKIVGHADRFKLASFCGRDRWDLVISICCMIWHCLQIIEVTDIYIADVRVVS